MDEEMHGASAAMLHVPQTSPFSDRREQDVHVHHPHSDVSGRSGSRGPSGRGRGRGRGRSTKRPSSGRDGHNMTAPTQPSRLQRPKANMMPRTLSDVLAEPKIALMHRVVNLAGPEIAWQTLMETLTIEEHGGLYANADACGRPAHMMQVSPMSPQQQTPRRRTKGGVFLTLLKTHVSKETYKKIFEVEEGLKKKRKKQMKYVKHQKMESKINALPLQELCIIGGGGKAPATAEREEGEDGEIDEEDIAMGDAGP